MRRAALVLAGALALAVGLFPHPAITDLPVHVTRFKLIADLLDGTARNPFYELDWRWLPNTLLDFVFAPLATFLPVGALSRLAAVLPVIVCLATIFWCRRRLFPNEPHPTLHLLLALPLVVLGDIYILGLHSFMVSACCAVAGYVALYRGNGARLPYAARQILSVLTVGIVCWLHLGGLLGLVVPALGDGIVALALAIRGGGRTTRRVLACSVDLALRYAGFVLPILVVLALLPGYVAGMDLQLDPPLPGPFKPGAWLASRIEAFVSPFSLLFEIRAPNLWWLLTELCILLLAVAILVLALSAWRTRRLSVDAGLLCAMPIAALLVLVFPDISANTAFVHWRPAFLLVVLATLAVSCRDLPKATIRIATTGAAMTLVIKALAFVALSIETTRAVADFRRAEGVIEPRSSVFLARAIDGEGLPVWQRSAHYWQLYQHIGAFAALDRDALVPNLFIGRGTQNLILREPYRDFSIPTATAFLPELLALRPTRPLDPTISQRERVAHWRSRIDYLVIVGWRVDRLSIPELGPPLHVGEGLRIHRVRPPR